MTLHKFLTTSCSLSQFKNILQKKKFIGENLKLLMRSSTVEFDHFESQNARISYFFIGD